MNADEELARLQTAAERAQTGYHHEEAVALYSQALKHLEENGIADAEIEYALRDGRSTSNGGGPSGSLGNTGNTIAVITANFSVANSSSRVI